MKPGVVLASCAGLLAGTVLGASRLCGGRSGPIAVACASAAESAPIAESLTVLDPPLRRACVARGPIETLLARPPVELTSVARAARIIALDRLRERFVETGSWSDGYELMFESILVTIDLRGPHRAHTEGRAPSGAQPDDVFHTYEDGREYAWRATEFPAMAEMITAHENLGRGESARSLRLSRLQHGEILECCARSRSLLFEPR